MSLTKATFMSAFNKCQWNKLEEYANYKQPIMTIPEIVKCADEIRKNKKKLVKDDLLTYTALIDLLMSSHSADSVIKFLINKNDCESLAYISNMGGEFSRELCEDTAENGQLTALISMIGSDNSYVHIKEILIKYDFGCNLNYPQDSFIIALHKHDLDKTKKILKNHPKIANTFDNFAIKYVCEHRDLQIVKLLLACDNVDPSVENNFPIKIAKAYQHYPIVLELLKHPLVSINEIDLEAVKRVIKEDHVCIAERMFNEEPEHMWTFFKKKNIIRMTLEQNNNVTSLAIKVGMITEIPYGMNLESDVEKKVKKQIRKYKSRDEEV